MAKCFYRKGLRGVLTYGACISVTAFLTWGFLFRMNTIVYLDDPSIKKTVHCNGGFVAYNNMFAKLANITLDPLKSRGQPGGEDIEKVIGQSEDSEYLSFDPGYFQMRCDKSFSYKFQSGRDHKRTWMNVLHISTRPELEYKYLEKDPVIVITRYEYANLYFVLNDFYNAFLMCKMFNLDPTDTTILILDGHPHGALDSSWGSIFGGMMRASDLRMQGTTMFRQMIWSILGYESPIHTNNFTPYLEEFREFFLSRLQIPHNRFLDCSKVNILLVWRRDYLAHPRNSKGKVVRKIANEDALLKTLKQAFPEHNINGVQLDLLPFQEQVELIVQTDIFVGMHGAGLGYTLFLPPHAALFEMFPNYGTTWNRHFRNMAEWRHLHYAQWQNSDSSLELDNYYTIIPPSAVENNIKSFIKDMCA